MPEVSVIITTHNRPHLLARAVESARRATLRDLEIILVDDASTDGTAEAAARIQGITYLRVERNQGVAGARNLGLVASRGEYVTFLDDDDVRLAGSLDRQIAELSGAPEAAFIYAQALLGAQDGAATEDFYPARCPRGDVFWELLVQNFVPCGTAVFRRSSLYSVGLLDDSIPGIDDWDLWVRLAERHQVLALDQPVMVWRKSTPRSEQGTSAALRMVRLSTKRFGRLWMRLPRAAGAPAQKRAEVRRRFSENMASHLIWNAYRLVAAGRPLDAQRNLLAALRLHPGASLRLLARPASFRSLFKLAPREWREVRGRAGEQGESEGRSG